MSSSLEISLDHPLTPSLERCLALIEDAFPIRISTKEILVDGNSSLQNLIACLGSLSSAAHNQQHDELSQVLNDIVTQSVLSADFGGYGLRQDTELTAEQEADVVFLCSAFLEAVKAERRTSSAPKPIDHRPEGRRAMTMTEKIFAMHEVTRKGYVTPGDVIQVDVDWVLASELSYGNGIAVAYDALGRPGIFRNDRFWLAGDHRVEPELYEKPAVAALMKTARQAQKEFKMTDFQGFNYTIMHTEFVRERAQPGMLCVGADSHSCSAGAVSCLSIGLGATDVAMSLITGQTWFTVPESVSLTLINAPPKGVGGKDTILYILQQFKRNTIAADRVVEFNGPGLRHLSCDARFAISNMCTEFGAVTGVFEADEQTLAFVGRRYQKKHKDKTIYFKPDEDAVYAEKYTVDLSKVQPFVAIYPSPDNVVPVGDVAGKKLDGCFIGACTTAEEDLIIASMVLEAGLLKGMRPVDKGRRLVVPGSKPLKAKLERYGMLDIYRKAGFKIGVPGCSMCVGQGTDQAQPGETWLSSQNRNFKNRMGPGSYGNVASAATVAASSFSMEITDPRGLLDTIDVDRLKEILGRRPTDDQAPQINELIHYKEPPSQDMQVKSVPDGISTQVRPEASALPTDSSPITGKALVLGDFVDTDAIIPSKFLAAGTTPEQLGPHCMEFFMPEFRQMAQNGQSIVVGGRAFGVGSSRDVAVNALLGTGVKAVIAKSFAFIYARNQPNLGLLGITMTDKRFHELAQDGQDVIIDMAASEIECGGERFPFTLSDIEKQLIAAGGMTEAFKKFGKRVFNELCKPLGSSQRSKTRDIEEVGTHQ